MTKVSYVIKMRHSVIKSAEIPTLPLAKAKLAELIADGYKNAYIETIYTPLGEGKLI